MKTRVVALAAPATLALVAGLFFACKRSPPPPSAGAVVEAPVPAPDGLTAEGTLRDPDAFWEKIRSGGGQALAAAPDSAAGILLAMAGADRRAASLISGSDPFEVALGDGPSGVAFAVAMKIRDLDAARSALAEGDTATFTTEDVGGMTHLVPRAKGVERVALAYTAGGYLVVASSVDDLPTLGAYAARTMPTKAAPSSSFELRASRTGLDRAKSKAPGFVSAVTGMIAAASRNALPPEVDAAAVANCFGPPFEALADATPDLAEARLDVDAEGAEVHAVATLTPKPGDNAARRRLAAMHPLDASPLLDESSEAAVSVLWGDTQADRLDAASTTGACVGKALAPVLGPAGPPLLADALASWAKGRGDWAIVSLLAKGSVAGALARSPVASAGDVTHAFQSAASLVGQPAVQDIIRRLLPLRAGGVETADVPPVGKAQVLFFAPASLPSHGDDAGPTSGMSPPGAAWFVDPREVHVAAGLSPKELLAQSRPGTSLGADPATARAVKALGGDASLAAVLRPPGCCTAGKGTAPLTLGWGRKGGSGSSGSSGLSGWASATLGDELLGMLAGRATR